MSGEARRELLRPRALFLSVFATGAAVVLLVGVRIRQGPSSALVLVKNSMNITHQAQCSDSWGVFRRNQSILTETQWIHRSTKASPPPFNISTIDQSFASLIVHENFAFCAIEKNACTQWNSVLRNMIHNKTDLGFNTPDYHLGKQSQQRYGPNKIKQLFESPNSTLVVMIRDPLARFASAYLEKCFAWKCSNGFCLARPASQKGQPISFRTALNWILSDHVNVSQIDGHWALQSTRCGIANGGLEHYYSIVGKMTKTSLQHDGACIMEMAGIERFNVNEKGESFWKTGGLHYQEHHQQLGDEETLLKKLYTPEAARQFMNKFRQDYDTFQLPEPPWVQEATGEWIDSLDHHSCAE